MKSIRLCRFVAALSISAAMLVAVAVAKDAACNPAVTPAPRSEAWWRQRHESMNARVQQGDVDLIFLGDSITHGWETGGKEVWERFYGSRNAVNLGIGGDQTQHVLWRLDNGNIAGISPKLAVIMIGTNNSGGQSPQQIAAGIKAIVDKLRTKLPQTKILLLAIFPRGADNHDALRQVTTKTNHIIARLADGKKVFYLDIGPKFLNADGKLSKQIMPDLLHPNAQGYEIWAEAIEPDVAKLMGENVSAALPVPRDGGWMERHKSFNARVKQGHADLIFIGDSITHGWEGNSKIWNRFYGNRNAVNLGISGDQTGQVLWRLDHGNLDGISPKLAVIMIGTNNAGHMPHQSPEQIAIGVKAIVDRLRTKVPQTKILLLAIFPRGADQNDAIRQINVKANQIIAKLADGKTVFYLDIGPKFLCPDGTLSKEIMPDLLHPNARGYEIWAEAIEPDVARLLGQHVNAALPLSRDDGWMQRHESFDARVKQGHVDLIFLGDSITHGWEGGGQEVWKKYYGHRNAVNLGIGGDQTGHVLWRLDHGNIDGIAPKLAVIMIGTNNIGGYTPAEIADGIKAIVEKLRTKLPCTKVLVLGVFPRGATLNDPLRQQQMQINKIVAKLADGKAVFFLDINAKFLTADGVLSREVFPDLVHLTPKAYETWAEAIEPTVAKLMDEK